ncbi:MAG: hypothetical protein BECKG1743D_GA0114223_110554 [Candidatus Kentron sp. G]|nr:MAG: hypothetical protein BECKG1743F_GA0114225_111232 [Candidatus Kentron sp. G]VFN07414.1 MAG: hypothetical protein BECKG1743D_GA0114223_110554 [Candidatus Kentron sp. G]
MYAFPSDANTYTDIRFGSSFLPRNYPLPAQSHPRQSKAPMRYPANGIGC